MSQEPRQGTQAFIQQAAHSFTRTALRQVSTITTLLNSANALWVTLLWWLGLTTTTYIVPPWMALLLSLSLYLSTTYLPRHPKAWQAVFLLGCQSPAAVTLLIWKIGAQASSTEIQPRDYEIPLMLLFILGSVFFLNRRFTILTTTSMVLQQLVLFYVLHPTLSFLQGWGAFWETLRREWLVLLQLMPLLVGGSLTVYVVIWFRSTLSTLHQEKQRRHQDETARQVAERANRAKSLFLAHINHELRTPLNAILGYTQILLWRKDIDTLHREGLQIIQGSGEHLRDLIDDVLDMSKIEARKMELVTTTTHLPDLVALVGKGLRARAELKELDFRLFVDPAVPAWVRTDEKRLRQVLLNLLGNAIKFTQRGYVSLEVGLSQELGPERARVRFSVEDSGPGIPEDRQEDIFEAFAQVGMHAKHAGTGLGLSISQQLVTLMGSQIHVSSRLGEGSLFWFDLEMEQSAPNPQREEHTRVKGYQGPRRHILVVDDRHINRALLQEMLENLDFQVTLARDGQEALEQIQAQAPDMVLMDLLMPRVNGVEATSLLRRQEGSQRRLPVVAVTASSMALEEGSLEAQLFDDLLRKPVLMPQLLSSIQQHLGLTWILEEIPSLPSRARMEQLQLAPIPQATLEEMRQLVEMGNLLALGDIAQEMIARDEHHRPFAEQLQQLVSHFDEQGLMDLLQHAEALSPS